MYLNLLILDFDDTLIDNTLSDIDSFRYISEKFHLSMPETETIISWRKNGMLAKTILNKMKGNRKKPTLKECVKERLDYLANGRGKINLFKEKCGARNTLKYIRKKGYCVVVISSRKNKIIIKKILRNLKLIKFIDNIYCAVDLQSNMNKTDLIEIKKYLYKRALEEYNSAVNDKTLVIGNLKDDIVAARKMKIKSLAIKGSYRFDSGISKLTPTINQFNEISNFL